MPYKRGRSYSAPGSTKRRRLSLRRRGMVSRRRSPYRRYAGRTGRKIRSAKATSRIPKTITIRQPAMSDRLFTTFTWRTVGFLQTSAAPAGGAAWRTYLLNGLGQVDQSATGPDTHYPRYVNQWLAMDFYRRYRVYAVTVEFRVASTTAATDNLMLVTQNQSSTDPGAVTATVAFQNGELPDWTTRVLDSTSDGSGGNVKVFRARYKLANVFGVKKGAIYSEDEYSGTLNAAAPPAIIVPTNTQYIHLGFSSHPANPIAGSTATYEVYFKFHAVLEDNANNAAVGAST